MHVYAYVLLKMHVLNGYDQSSYLEKVQLTTHSQIVHIILTENNVK